MNTLQAGFSRVNVTPMLGISVSGYFVSRKAQTILDELEVNCLALSCGETKVLLMSVDNLGIKQQVLTPVRQKISEATGVPADAVYIHCTHTHTGPAMYPNPKTPLEQEYQQMLCRKLEDAAVLALADRKPARMGIGVGQAPNIAFVRRFRMKDGSVQTNPGVDNPNILAPIGDVDERVNVLRFDREDDTLVLMNFGCHPDTVGGCRISADWPGFARSNLEQAIPGVKSLFFNGAQGDVNHVSVHPRGGDLNDLENDFDDVTRGYGHARHMGRVVAGAVLQVFDKVQYMDVDRLAFAQKTVQVPSNMPAADEIEEAHRLADLHNSGRDDLIPYSGMMLTTVVAEALRRVRLENGPEAFEMPMSAIAIGNVAMIGLPGEPFTGIGRGLKLAEGWDLVLPSCNTNAAEGYFPMMDAYDEGGYEARSSNYKAGVAEFLIREGSELLASLREK